MKAWLVNTNVGNQNCIEYMIRHNKVAAYYPDTNTQIDGIKENDLVLLYHNDNRIVAVGCVVKRFVGHVYQKDMGDIEHWTDVNWIWKASFDKELNPTNFITRTSKLGIPMVGRTVVNITDHLDYKLLLEEIAKRQIYM